MADMRIPLPKGTVLEFEGLPCTIDGLLGRGSNALVYRGSYRDSASPDTIHHALIKELFPLHPRGGIVRAEDGTIMVDESAEELYALHKRSFERGNELQLRLLAQSPSMIGANLNTYIYNGTLYTLLGCSGGSTLDTLIGRPGATLRSIAQRMLCLLEALEVFHTEQLLHMDIAPDNILVIPQGSREHVILIDYNSIGSIREWQSGDPSVVSVKEGYTAPEIVTGRTDRVGFASDLYSVTAVFFACLMGRPLELAERVGRGVPDVSSSAYLKGVPETVRAMVDTILRRGLAALPKRRYPDIAAMRADIEQLLDRIDCVGVTRWAIREKENGRLEGLLHRNPAMEYLLSDDSLYPIRFTEEDRELGPEELLSELSAEDAQPILLEAAGGMGKTTCLMQLARRCNRVWREDRPVAVYIEADRYEAGSTRFVHDRMMSSLRFKPDTPGYDSALHELDRLMSARIVTRTGSCPSLILLLDGINEIRGDIAPLKAELDALLQLPGVAVLLSSRSDTELPGRTLRRLAIRPLSEPYIRERLGRAGLLMPEEESVRALLSTPLMLSILLRTAAASEGQLTVKSADDLLGGMLRTEVEQLPEEDALRWQTDVAVRYVLPAIAGECLRQGRALKDAELIGIVGQCHLSLRRAWLLRSVFPQWLGRTALIMQDCRDAEQWYGRLVHELLWRRLGLLVRDEEHSYRVSHQTIEEWLAARNAVTQRAIARCRRRHDVLRAIPITVLLAVCAVAGSRAYHGVVDRIVQPAPTYPPQLTDQALTAAQMVLWEIGEIYDVAAEVLSTEIPDARALETLRSCLEREGSAGLMCAYLDELEKANENGAEVVDISGKEMDLAGYRELAEYRDELKKEWQGYLDGLQYLSDPENENKIGAGWRDACKSWPSRLRELLEAQKAVTWDLFWLAAGVHYANGGDGSVSSESWNMITAAQSLCPPTGSVERDDTALSRDRAAESKARGEDQADVNGYLNGLIQAEG